MEWLMQPPVNYFGPPLKGYERDQPCIWCTRPGTVLLLGRDMKYYPDCGLQIIPDYAEDFFIMEGRDE